MCQATVGAGMDRRQFIAGSSAALVAVTAGCLGSVLEDESRPSVQGATAAQHTDAEYATATVEVSASGTAETDPDKAVATVGVEVTGETADEVRSELVERSEDVRRAMADLGIPEDDIQTTRYSIRERRRGTGFEGVHAYSVEVDDVDRVGAVIDAAVDAGADTVGRVNFTLQDETRETLRNEALDDALATADAEAEHIADNRDVEITGTVSVSTSDVRVSSVRYDAAHDAPVEDADDAAPTTEIETGPVTVSATVTVVYAIAD